MKFVIVTGLSGAGKSMAVNALEDIGFFCIDNIPVALLPRIVDFALQGENQLNRVAVVMDVRGVRSSEQLEQALSDLDARKFEYEILFLDANDAVIQRRYKETRRQHPITISEKLPITEAIARERRLLQPLRARAQYVIDTSLLSTAQNKERVCSLFLDHGESPMALTVVSFGFKYGLPQEADLVLDVRCLPNPFYVPELKNLTGLDEEVVDYVMAAPESQELLRRYDVRACYYGHLHGISHKLAMEGLWDGVEFRLLAADYLNFCPAKIISEEMQENGGQSAANLLE